MVAFVVALLAGLSVQPDDGFNGDVRVRYANVDDNINKTATALTARVLLSWNSQDWNGWDVNLGIEHVNDFDVHSYNDGGSNGQIQYATEADPSGTELDEAYLQFKNDKLQIRYGRQYMDHGELPQRYLSTASWRQNYQTMDGLTVTGQINDQFSIEGAMVERAYRVIGRSHPNRLAREFDLDGIGLMATLDSETFGKNYGYLYNLDFVHNPSLSTRTFGFRREARCLQGLGELEWPGDCELEIATQKGIGSNPYDASHGYLRVKLGLDLDEVMNESGPIGSIGLAFSRYGGDGESSFRTPLAAVHGFVGWADKVLINTPSDGLTDTELIYSVDVLGWETKFVFHRFSSAEKIDGETVNYGRELDAVASRDIGRYTLQLKLANYQGNEDLKPSPLGVDISKFWVSVSFSI